LAIQRQPGNSTDCRTTEDGMATALLTTDLVREEILGSDRPIDYETRRQEHLGVMRSRVPEHLERMGWPAERLQEERDTRLRRLVRTAQERSLWHRERLGHLNPQTITEADLVHIPAMTKHDLMTNYDRIVTDPRLSLDRIEAHLDGLVSDAYLLGEFHAVASGGSSGQRGVFVYGLESWADCFLSCLRYTVRARMQIPELMQRPMRIATVAAERATHMSSSLPRTFTDSMSTTAVPVPITQPLSRIIAGLNEANPDVMIAYPSVLPELAHEARAGRLRIAPRFIGSASEPLLPEIRAVTEETWGVPVMNWWASSEAGGMAISCGQGAGLHLSDDLIIVEPVDTAGRPVPPGTRSDKIYLTNLFNPVLPLIRFEITDQITVMDDPAPCLCGSAHRRIEDVQGRLDDLFVYPGVGPVHPHIFRSRLGADRNIVEYQVRQTSWGAAIAVRCIGDVDLMRLQRALTDDLRRLGLHEPEITVRQVEHLERQATGKLKRFLPLSANAA
jgi:phenylacetate-coenzyme A ligase PaaK-like adenylate-forming protein